MEWRAKPKRPLCRTGRLLAHLSLAGAAALGCGEATDLPATGSISVQVRTAGPEPDTNGYRVRVDGAAARSLGVEDSTHFPGLEPGSHAVELTDVAANCAERGDGLRQATVVADATVGMAFEVTCEATAALRVVTMSDGAPADPDGYQLVVQRRGTRAIGDNASITMTGLLGDRIAVQLTSLASGCTVAGSADRLVPLVAGDTAEATFQVHCAPAPPGEGTIIVTVQTTAVNAPTPTSYTLTLDGGRPTSVAASQSVTLDHVPAGAHSVALSGLPSYCGVGLFGSGSNPEQVRVVAEAAARVTFAVLCLG